MAKNKIIEVQHTTITIYDNKGEDYICITDMAKAKTDNARAADVIKNWLRTRTTLEFLGAWEKIYNPNFKVVELVLHNGSKKQMLLVFFLRLEDMAEPLHTKILPLSLAPLSVLNLSYI